LHLTIGIEEGSTGMNHRKIILLARAVFSGKR